MKMKIQPIGKLYDNINTMKVASSEPVLPNKKHEKNNLHKSFSVMLVVSQVFGYLPVQGVLGPDFRSLRFNWKSLRVAHAVLNISAAAFVCVVQIHQIFLKGFDLMEANRLFFHCNGIVGGLLFLRLAKNWPIFIKEWISVEQTMVSYGWPSRLGRNINTLLVVFMVLALAEYLLGQSSKLVFALNCKQTTFEAITYFLSNMSFSELFSILNLDILSGVIVQISNIQVCFLWTFNDVFVMIVSLAIANRFAQITTRIQSISDAKIDSEVAWKNVREDYNRLCRLCRRVDDEISYIVLMTFASDLFFILVQLFNSLRPMKNDLQRVYFYGSFGFLIIRTVSLCLFGAKVNDESVKPMLILNSVSSDVYNPEIQRFIQQIGTSEIAITGKNFFSITRGLILSIAGAIVTYELVLIQFNDTLLKSAPEEEACPVLV